MEGYGPYASPQFQWQLFNQMLMVFADFAVQVPSDHPIRGLNVSGKQLEKSRFAGSIRPNQCHSRIQINAKIQVSVDPGL